MQKSNVDPLPSRQAELQNLILRVHVLYIILAGMNRLKTCVVTNQHRNKKPIQLTCVLLLFVSYMGEVQNRLYSHMSSISNNLNMQ